MRRNDIEVHAEVNANGKRIVALCVLLIVGGGWAGLAPRYTGRAAPASPRAETGSGEGVRSFLSDANSPGLSPTGLDDGGLFPRMMLAVGIVFGMGILALYVSKRVLPRAVNSAGREIRILETTYLGPRKTLHLVEVGARRLLIASTAESITMLASLDEKQPEVSQLPVDDGAEM